MQLKRLVQAYTKELKWRDEDYMPKTLEEHFEVSMRSSGGFTLAAASFVGMDDIATKDIFEWILSYPSLFKTFDIFVRLSNDIVSNKVLLYLYMFGHSIPSWFERVSTPTQCIRLIRVMAQACAQTHS